MLLRLLEPADCMWELRKGRILIHLTKRVEVLFTEMNVRETESALLGRNVKNLHPHWCCSGPEK